MARFLRSDLLTGIECNCNLINHREITKAGENDNPLV